MLMPSSPRTQTNPASRPPGWSRRQFLHTLTQSAAASAFLRSPSLVARAAARPENDAAQPPKRIALLATEVRKYSHAQHFVDRFLEGYGWHGRYYHPRLDLVSLYVDQFPENDLSRDRSRRFGVPIFPTIAEALTLGQGQLAVDGVVIIGEHGKYPRNEKGQTLYPRYKFFKQVVEVFTASGRSVPVFNDKHLSTNWNECVEMVADSKRLGFAFLAGSSLPVTWRIPSLEIPLHTPLQESVSVCYGGVDSYDFHGFETAQCMSERRAGGETGVRSVHAVRGDKVWKMLAERDHTRELLLAALARSHTLKAPTGYTCWVPDLDWMSRNCPDAVAWFLEHRDGFKTAMFQLNGLVSDFTYAGSVKETGDIHSCLMYLPMPPRYSTLADFFNPLAHHIEETILTGRASYPVERTLLTSGMTLFGVQSLFRGQVPVETPELKVAYQVDGRSTFWRA
jgi:hypothetical protein